MATEARNRILGPTVYLCIALQTIRTRDGKNHWREQIKEKGPQWLPGGGLENSGGRQYPPDPTSMEGFLEGGGATTRPAAAGPPTTSHLRPELLVAAEHDPPVPPTTAIFEAP
jgi:hypothetical protein